MSRVGPSTRGFFVDDSVPLASAKDAKDRFEVFWAIAVVITEFGGYRGDIVRSKRVDAISNARHSGHMTSIKFRYVSKRGFRG